MARSARPLASCPRLPLLATCMAVATALSGCTGLGVGIGIAIDSGSDPERVTRDSRTQEAFERRFEVSPGDSVELVLTSGERVEGTYRGFAAGASREREPRLLLGKRGWTRLAAPPPGAAPPEVPTREIPLPEIETVATPPGAGWMVGMLAGLVLDAIVIAGFVAAVGAL